ncbi:MAG: hypothetical protein CTY20_02555 [Hyphomicrobium sp.]|nr:MAG: hypothetical protein CTY20_02555 [Hyphomicrobium sp.]
MPELSPFGGVPLARANRRRGATFEFPDILYFVFENPPPMGGICTVLPVGSSDSPDAHISKLKSRLVARLGDLDAVKRATCRVLLASSRTGKMTIARMNAGDQPVSVLNP